jgi:hypothetical protein
MIEIITLIIVVLLLSERIIHYYTRVQIGDFKKAFKSLYESLNLLNKIRWFLWKKHPRPSKELMISWQKSSWEKAIDTPEKVEFMEEWNFNLFHIKYKKNKVDLTEKEANTLATYNQLYDSISKEYFKLELEWLKSHSPTFYWIRKLKFIKPISL